MNLVQIISVENKGGMGIFQGNFALALLPAANKAQSNRLTT